MIGVMFGKLNKKISDLKERREKLAVKAVSHQSIVYKLMVINSLVGYLKPAPLYRPGQTFFDIDHKHLTDGLNPQLSLTEVCLRTKRSITDGRLPVKEIINTPPTTEGKSADHCALSIVNAITRACDNAFPNTYFGPAIFSSKKVDSRYFKCIHRELNVIFMGLMSFLFKSNVMVSVDIQKATPVELDWLMAINQGLEPILKDFDFYSLLSTETTEWLQVHVRRHEPDYLNSQPTPWGFEDPNRASKKGIEVEYNPTTNWAIGGVLFDKYDLEISRFEEGSIEAYPANEKGRPACGPTRLIAGMRSILRTTKEVSEVNDMDTVPVVFALSRVDKKMWDTFDTKECR